MRIFLIGKKTKCILLSIIIVFCLSFTGCGTNMAVNDQLESVENQVKYADDRVLFVAQDRCDIEDDRLTLYAYNYKGELLESSGYIRYYAENGLAPALDKNTNKVGFVDKEGVFQIPPKYDDAAPFSKSGIALVALETKIEGNYDVKKCGYVKTDGKELVPCIYDSATSFFDCGYAIAATDKSVTDEDGYSHSTLWKQYIIDEKGNEVIEVDTIAEKLYIAAVYKDYFVCEDEEKIILLDYSKNIIFEMEAPGEKGTEYIDYSLGKKHIIKSTYDMSKGQLIKTEYFDGKKLVEDKKDYVKTSKQVATTQSGKGYGITVDNKTVIPFEYDAIIEYGEYFVAIKYTGENPIFDQCFDIYDKNYNKTAENMEYAFDHRKEIYGEECQLPNGYFPIMIKNGEYNDNFNGMVSYRCVNGIIDYTGKIIVEPVFDSKIILYTYEGTGVFALR